MKFFFVLLTLLVVGCVSPDPARYGTEIVATDGCRDPQTAYAADIVNLNGYGLAAWQTQADLSQTVVLSVACEDFTSNCMDFHDASACGMQAGYFDLGTSTIHVDPGRANGEFAFSGVMNHEATHWYINQGPHPERAQMHVCSCDSDWATNPRCWPLECGEDNLMSVTLTGLGTGTDTSWDGNIETLDSDWVTVNAPTPQDLRFVTWAVTP